MRVITAAYLATAFAARYPNPGGDSALPGVIPSIDAGAGKVDAVEAAAIRPGSTPQGKLQWVRATGGHFLVAGELVKEGEYVQLPKNIATRLVHSQQAVEVSEDEVNKAEAEEAAAATKGKK